MVSDLQFDSNAVGRKKEKYSHVRTIKIEYAPSLEYYNGATQDVSKLLEDQANTARECRRIQPVYRRQTTYTERRQHTQYKEV
jgi:hypothetical protein